MENNGLKKGPWTQEEDQKLVDYIQKHGYGNWRTLPKNAGRVSFLSAKKNILFTKIYVLRKIHSNDVTVTSCYCDLELVVRKRKRMLLAILTVQFQ